MKNILLCVLLGSVLAGCVYDGGQHRYSPVYGGEHRDDAHREDRPVREQQPDYRRDDRSSRQNNSRSDERNTRRDQGDNENRGDHQGRD